MSKNFTLSNRRRTPGVRGSAHSFPVLRVYARVLIPNSTLAVLSIAPSRASSSQFHHSTSLLLVEISLAVRIADLFPFVLLTTTDSTRSRR